MNHNSSSEAKASKKACPAYPSLSHIPCELLLIIAGYCDTQSFARLSQTCKGFHHALTLDKVKRAKQKALLPADVYRQRFVYNDDQIPGIDRPLHLLTDNFSSYEAIWNQAMSRRGFSNHEGRFVRAVHKGKIHGVRALLEMGVNPNSYDCSGVWAFNLAVDNQDLEMVDLLLSYGADPNVRDIPCQKNVLDYAAYDNAMTQRLVLAGADLSEPRDIENIVCRNNLETISMALERMRSVSLPNPERMPTLVIFAAQRGDRDILSLVLSQPFSGLMLNDVRIYEGSALHTAIKNRREELAWMLITAGIDINLTSGDGTTALHLALEQQFFDLACGLIEAGCALDRVTRQGKTELHFAVEAKSVEMVRLLLSKGVDVDLRGPRTFIHTPESVIRDAIRVGNEDIIRAILTEGSHPPDLTLADLGLFNVS
ncbi:uncharacterized protein N7484_003302 [Penicillium longicatenatum]|uniref:uncharacterized protein n=1 Tax=Penicillium longicatenatum TaxID=1561947 RepID=UPI002546CDD9|nr:uncharacterized protein N7484_003302 [Penicillium longicatenatum]KAJ5649579.1 hypothetical protein N7484_003302 [Penicillium longicatenatum]